MPSHVMDPSGKVEKIYRSSLQKILNAAATWILIDIYLYTLRGTYTNTRALLMRLYAYVYTGVFVFVCVWECMFMYDSFLFHSLPSKRKSGKKQKKMTELETPT